MKIHQRKGKSNVVNMREPLIIFCYLFPTIVGAADHGSCQHPSRGLSTPSFVSGWYDAIARNESLSLITIKHNLGVYPALVDVQVKVHDNGTGEDYIFTGTGSAQRDDDLNYKYGGVIYKYNKAKIKLSTPFAADSVSSYNTGYTVFTGYPELFTGPPEVTGYYIQGKVRVRVWTESDMPECVFSSSVDMSIFTTTFAEVPHYLGYYPDYVTVQILMENGYMSDGIGTVSNSIYRSRWKGIGGVLYGYDDACIRLWAPHAYEVKIGQQGVFFGTDGWKLGLSRNGTVLIKAWRLHHQTLFYSREFVAGKGFDNDDTFIFPENFDISKYLVIVQVYTNDGNNTGMIFNGEGSTMATGQSGYGGVIYGYTSEKVLIWRPNDTLVKGSMVYIGGQWGAGQYSQNSSIAVVIIRVFKLQPKDMVCTPSFSSGNEIKNIRRGKLFNNAIIYSTKVPSKFICADICLRMSACASISYNIQNRTCNIAEATWQQVGTILLDHENYIYLERADMHMTTSEECLQHPCEGNEMCTSSINQKVNCVSVVSCRDGTIPEYICQQNAQAGGCLKSNIGKNIINQSSPWTYGDWMLMQRSCRLSCGLC